MACGGNTNISISLDESRDILCEDCERNGKTCAAEKYCKDCREYYCLSCVNVHKDIALLTDHRILGKGQFPRNSKYTHTRPKITPSEDMTERCEKHSLDCMDKYCRSHDVVGCSTCIALDHGSCQDISNIPDHFTWKTVKKSTKGIQRKLKPVLKTLREHNEYLEKKKKQLMGSKQSTLNYIKKCRKEINDRLDQLEKCTIAATEDKYKILLHEIEKEIQLIDSTIYVQQGLERSGNTSQTFVDIRKVENLAKRAAESEERSKSIVSSIFFHPDHRLSSLLQEMTGLGKINEKMSAQAESMRTINLQMKKSLLQVSGRKKYNVKVRSDIEQCEIVSACTLEDGTILLSDYYNRKLKRLHSTSYTIIDYCDLFGKPWQVCSINKQKAAVCLPNMQEVHFISLTDKMTSTIEIAATFTCYGLACAHDNLYISDDYTSVYVYSISEGVLKLFIDPLFADIRTLAVNKDGSMIYVCDFDNRLIILDKNGRFVWETNAFESSPAKTGSILVCGRLSNNVLEFGMNGELIGEVVKFDGEIGIMAVCCNQQTSKLIACKLWQNEIEVLDLV